MQKKLISIRIPQEILDKVDTFRNNREVRTSLVCKQLMFSHKYYLLNGSPYRPLSVADVIEFALIEFFEKYKI